MSLIVWESEKVCEMAWSMYCFFLQRVLLECVLGFVNFECNYEFVKGRILQVYRLVLDTYHQKFRTFYERG